MRFGVAFRYLPLSTECIKKFREVLIFLLPFPALTESGIFSKSKLREKFFY